MLKGDKDLTGLQEPGRFKFSSCSQGATKDTGELPFHSWVIPVNPAHSPYQPGMSNLPRVPLVCLDLTVNCISPANCPELPDIGCFGGFQH